VEHKERKKKKPPGPMVITGQMEERRKLRIKRGRPGTIERRALEKMTSQGHLRGLTIEKKRGTDFSAYRSYRKEVEKTRVVVDKTKHG